MHASTTQHMASSPDDHPDSPSPFLGDGLSAALPLLSRISHPDLTTMSPPLPPLPPTHTHPPADLHNWKLPSPNRRPALRSPHLGPARRQGHGQARPHGGAHILAPLAKCLSPFCSIRPLPLPLSTFFCPSAKSALTRNGIVRSNFSPPDPLSMWMVETWNGILYLVYTACILGSG